MNEDILIVKNVFPELNVRALGFDHEFTDYNKRKTLEFRVDGYLGWWVYYRDTRQIVLNISDSNYQSYTTYKTRNEIVNYLKNEDAADKINRKLPNFSFRIGYVGWVKRYKLQKILNICEGTEAYELKDL